MNDVLLNLSVEMDALARPRASHARGQHKAGVQWRLYGLVHDIEKVAGCELKQ